MVSAAIPIVDVGQDDLAGVITGCGEDGFELG